MGMCIAVFMGMVPACVDEDQSMNSSVNDKHGEEPYEAADSSVVQRDAESQDEVTLSGRVMNGRGRPVSHATIWLLHGVQNIPLAVVSTDAGIAVLR